MGVMFDVHIVSFAFAMVIFALMPGPGVLATISRTIRHGERSAMFLVLGLILGDILYASFAVFGLGAIAQLMGTAFIWIRWISGLYLVYLGYRALAQHQEELAAPKTQSGKSFLIGLFISLGNPKVIVFYLGFLPAFFDMHTVTFWVYLQIVSVITLVAIPVLGMYVKLAGTLTRRIDGTNFHRFLSRIAGTVMMVAGVKVVTS